MALSNWFIVAWDKEGNNYLEMPKVKIKGLTIEVIKNYLSIFKRNKWILDLYSGEIEGTRFSIKAKRGKQNSIYAIITWFTGIKNTKMHRLYVIAGYTFKDDEEVGCLPSTVEDFKRWIKETLELEELPSFKDAISQNQGDIYFSKELGLPRQYQKVGEKPPKTYFEIILENM